jgi:phosphatidylglycerophosphate synthase
MKIWMDTANTLTFVRLVLAPIAFVAILWLDWPIVVSILLFAGATDILDGYFARRRKRECRWGKIFDSSTDKIFMGFLIVALLIRYHLSLYFVLLFISRDLLALALFGIPIISFAPKIREKISFSPSKFGKMLTGFQALTVLLIILGNNFHDITLYTTFLLSIGCMIDKWLSLSSVLR